MCPIFATLIAYLLCSLASPIAGVRSWRIEEHTIEFNIEENCPLGMELGSVVSPSQKASTALYYELGSPSMFFRVDKMTGQISTIAPIDAEQLCAQAKAKEPAVVLSKRTDTIPVNQISDQVSCEPSGKVTVHLDVNAMLHDASLHAVHRVKVHVHDLNDNWPRFDQPKWHRKLKEMLYRKGRRIELPKATDADLLVEYSRVRYHLEPVDPKQPLNIPFRLEVQPPGQPGLVLTEDLDAETKENHSFVLVASSLSPVWPGNQLEQTAIANNGTRLTVVIEVVDMNDNEPKFDSTTYNVSVAENTTPGTIIYKLVAHDPDKSSNLSYSLAMPSEHTQLDSTFQVDLDGNVRLSGFLDFELKSTHLIQVKASDGEFNAQAQLIVNVIDVNDEPPEFEVNPQQLVADENAPAGKLIGRIRIKDPDSATVNGEVRCWEPPEARNKQQLVFTPDPDVNPNSEVYDLTTRFMLDRESSIDRDSLTVRLICADGFGGHDVESLRHTATMSIVLTIRDENDHPPVFSQSKYHATMKENNQLGDKVLQVNASDADDGINAEIVFTLSDVTHFAIDPSSGWVTAKVVLDREVRDSYQVTIFATDQGQPRLSSSALLTLTVLDTNDHPPLFQNHEDWVTPIDPTRLPASGRLSATGNLFVVTEHMAPYTHIGDVYAEDKDVDLNGKVTYALFNSDAAQSKFNSRFRLLSNGSLYTTVELDREEKEQYDLVITAQDSSTTEPLTSTGTITIRILDVNDHAPAFVQPKGLLEPKFKKKLDLSEFPSTMLYDQPVQNEKHLNKEEASTMDTAIHLSVHEKPGFLVTTLHAKDSDVGRNGRVTYGLEETLRRYTESLRPNHDALLRVRPDRGDVHVKRHMTVRDLGKHLFEISATDDGYPESKSDNKVLVVYVEDRPAMGMQQNIHSSSYYSSNLTNPKFDFWLFEGRSNVLIITILASISGLLAVVLIVATVCVVKSPNTRRCCQRSNDHEIGERPITAPGSSEVENGQTIDGRHNGYPPHHLHESPTILRNYPPGSVLSPFFCEEQQYRCGRDGCGYLDVSFNHGDIAGYAAATMNQVAEDHIEASKPLLSPTGLADSFPTSLRRETDLDLAEEHSRDNLIVSLPRSHDFKGVRFNPIHETPAKLRNVQTFCVVKPIPITATSLSSLKNPGSPMINLSDRQTGVHILMQEYQDSSSNSQHVSEIALNAAYPLEENHSDSGKGTSENEEMPNSFTNLFPQHSHYPMSNYP